MADNDVQFKVSKITGAFVLFDGAEVAPGLHLYSAFTRVPKKYDKVAVLDGIAFPMSKVKIGASQHGIFTGVRENRAMKTITGLCFMLSNRVPRIEDTLQLNRLTPLTEEADADDKQRAADAMDEYVQRSALCTGLLSRPSYARALSYPSRTFCVRNPVHSLRARACARHAWHACHPPPHSHTRRMTNPLKRSSSTNSDDADEEVAMPPPSKVRKKAKAPTQKPKAPKAPKASKAPKYREVARGTLPELRTMAKEVGLTYSKAENNRTFLIRALVEHYGLEPDAPPPQLAKAKIAAKGKGKKEQAEVASEGDCGVNVDSDIDNDPEVQVMLKQIARQKASKDEVAKEDRKRKRIAELQKEMEKNSGGSSHALAAAGEASPESALMKAFGGHSPYQKLASRGATFQIFQHGAFAGATVTMMGPQDHAASGPPSHSGSHASRSTASVGSGRSTGVRYDRYTSPDVHQPRGRTRPHHAHYDDPRTHSRY